MNAALIKSTKPKRNLEKDEFGFGIDTTGSFLIRHLADGQCTRDELLKQFTEADWKPFGAGSETKRNRVTFSVFMADVSKPFGRYHGARSLIITKDEKTGKLSLDPKRANLVLRAINNGILEDIKGLKFAEHWPKIATVLKKHGLPSEAPAKKKSAPPKKAVKKAVKRA